MPHPKRIALYTTLLLLGGLLLAPVITYATLTLDSTSLTSDGALTLKSASSSATTLGDPDQSGTITIASSTQTLTLNLGVGSGAATVNIATGTSTAKTINIGTGASTANAITIGTASSTVLIGGNITLASSTNPMTLNLGANTGRHTVNIATGQASSTINIGSSSSTIVVNNFWTTLPTSPVDGQEIVYAASSTAGIYWHLKYDAGSASTYKWVFFGGSALISEDVTGGTTNSTSYGDVGTAPQVTVPRTGEYEITFYSEVGPNAGNQAVSQYSVRIAPKLGAATAVDADSTMLQDETATETRGGIGRTIVKTLTAGDVIKLQGRVNAGTGSMQRSGLKIVPIRVN